MRFVGTLTVFVAYSLWFSDLETLNINVIRMIIHMLNCVPVLRSSIMVQSRGIDRRLGRSRDVTVAGYRSRIGRYAK